MAADKTQQVMVRLSPDLHQQLKAKADNEERTVSQTIRLAIKTYLGVTQPAG
jgi:predicted DNA-binding protein